MECGPSPWSSTVDWTSGASGRSLTPSRNNLFPFYLLLSLYTIPLFLSLFLSAGED